MKSNIGTKISQNLELNSIILPLFLAVTLGIFGPLALYITNINEFWFSIGDIWWIAVTVGIGLFALGVGVSIILKKKIIRDIYFCLLFGLVLGFYIQGNYINADYGVMNGDSIDWSSYTGVAIINTISWMICIVLPFALYFIIPKNWKKIISYASIFIILIQVTSLAVLFITTDLSKNKTDAYLTDEGQFNLSSNKNVLIFVLDAYDSSFFQELLEKYPELTNTFDNFTYFPDTAGGATRTSVAVPVILTGKAWTKPVSYSEYLDEAYSETELYNVLKANAYDTRIYTKSSFVPLSQLDNISNLSSGHGVVSSHLLLTKYLYKFTAFRYMPHLLKSKFWFYSGVFEELYSGSGSSNYNIDDIDYYNTLLNGKISTDIKGNAFRLYHLLGAHPPFIINEYAQEVPSDDTTQLKQARGALYIIEEYINQLKKEGIYDNTAIVIMADHGNVNDEQNPLFMIKTFNEDKDFQINNAPISYFDLHTTLLSIITGNNKYGETIFDKKVGDTNKRLFYKLSNEQGITVTEYQINGHAWDKAAFSATGNAYHGDSQSYTYSYKLGAPLTFGSTGTATEFLISGFSYGSTGGHTWTNDTAAKMRFILDKEPKSDLVVKINAIAYDGISNQRMIVSVGDKVVSEWAYSGTVDIEFAVPQELVDGNTLEIDYKLPDAISPETVLGPGNDPRKLAFAFTKISISEGKPENPNIAYNYSLGDPIEFVDDNDGSKYFMYGIGKINDGYAWSVGAGSGIIMNLGDIKRELECSIDFTNVLNGSQKVIVSSNSMTLFDNIVTSNNRNITFKIPAECINDGTVSLYFDYPDAASPLDLGIGKDTRTLSLAFKKIVIK